MRDGKIVSDGRDGAGHCLERGGRDDASETLRVAWEGLTLNKVRSFLTTLGVIIGVASVIMMLAVSAGAEAAIADQINALGANLIIVNPVRGVPGAAQTLTYDDAVAIEEAVRNAEGVSAEFQVVQDVSSARAKLDGSPSWASRPTSPRCAITASARAASSPLTRTTARSRWSCWAMASPRICSARKAPSARPSRSAQPS